jgi:hypothetical protein
MLGLAGGPCLPNHHRQSQSTSRYASPSKPTHAISGSAPSTFATMQFPSPTTPTSLARPLSRAVMTESATTSRRRWRPQLSKSSFLPTNILLMLLLALLVITPTSAAQIKFENCLPDNIQLANPKPLQWQPLYANASFDTKNQGHKIQVRVWGNVTGSQNQGILPPANDSYWTDKDQTNGKIVQVPGNIDNGSATTLLRHVDFLSYAPVRQAADFCETGLTNGTCPLAPVFSLDEA